MVTTCIKKTKKLQLWTQNTQCFVRNYDIPCRRSIMANHWDIWLALHCREWINSPRLSSLENKLWPLHKFRIRICGYVYLFTMTSKSWFFFVLAALLLPLCRDHRWPQRLSCRQSGCWVHHGTNIDELRGHTQSIGWNLKKADRQLPTHLPQVLFSFELINIKLSKPAPYTSSQVLLTHICSWVHTRKQSEVGVSHYRPRITLNVKNNYIVKTMIPIYTLFSIQRTKSFINKLLEYYLNAWQPFPFSSPTAKRDHQGPHQRSWGLIQSNLKPNSLALTKLLQWLFYI